MKNRMLVKNGKIITPFETISDGAVYIEEGNIKDIGKVEEFHRGVERGITEIDARGHYVSPGFIDLHVHGGGGGDVMSATSSDLIQIAKTHACGGTTAMIATTLTASLKEITGALQCIDEIYQKPTGGAIIAGSHVEGPYFSYNQRGAQNPALLREPTRDEYMPILDKFKSIKCVSIAPELPGALELGRVLRERQITASIGHSDATYSQVLKAVSHGYTRVTHVFSGMSRFKRENSYRISGVLESALIMDELYAEIIADGHHLPPSLIKLVLKAKGQDKVCLVTDAIPAAGLGPGQYTLGGLDIVVEFDTPKCYEVNNGHQGCVGKLKDKTAFAGSVASMNQLVRNMVYLVGLSVGDAVKLATYNPAKIQGLKDRGILAPGMRGDIVIFNEDIEIQKTIVGGEVVFSNS